MLQAGHARVLKWSAGGAAAFLLVASLATGAIAGIVADHVLHPPREVPAWTPADVGIPYEKVAFPARDGVPLVGWWMPATASLGTVVFLHGYGASKAQSLAVAPFLHEAGYNVLAYDARAHGESGGDHTTLGLEEVRDVEGAWDWLAARGGVQPVALFGWSMGGATAINAAPHLPGVDAVIADSSFASLAAVGGRTATSLAHLPEYPFGAATLLAAGWMSGHAAGEDAPVRAAADAEQPLLLIQGGADTLVPPDQARQLQAAAGARATLWLVPEAPHIDAIHNDAAEYEHRVLAFLHASLP